MLWLCEKPMSENLFDSVLRWWYPGVLVNTGESRGPGDQFNRGLPVFYTRSFEVTLSEKFTRKYRISILIEGKLYIERTLLK